MAEFFENLFNSIFTPGPTPTLVVATNAAFAGLQLLLLALLVGTRSIHFVILSVLSGGLWWAINWFVREINTLRAQEVQEKAAEASGRGGSGISERKELRAGPMSAQGGVQDDPADSEDTETEEMERRMTRSSARKTEASSSSLKPEVVDARKRRSAGEVSGTDSEWEKLSESEIKQ